MNIIVFGGSGFMGSHVADALSQAGHRVRIFDQKQSLYLHHDQEMIVGDILDRDAVARAMVGCDVVYNLAGIADLDDATTKPFETVRLNVMGSVQVMEAAAAASISRYIYASSIYVYSQKGGFYRCSKQASEVYVEEFQRRFGLDFTILRYGTLYGPRADNRNSIYRYLYQAMTSDRICCAGNGEEIRDYIHVRDAARLSVEVLKDEFRNKHIIISGHTSMKLKDMLLIIAELTDRNVTIQFQNKENTDHYDYTPYSYAPKIGNKLVHHLCVDVGQGLLECLYDMNGHYHWND